MKLAMRRADTQKIIDNDPWDVTIYRDGITPDDAEITFSCVGSITASGARGAPRERAAANMPGESPVGRYGWVLLAPWDTVVFKTRDTVVAVQQSTSISREFTVVYSGQYAYKHEVILDERQ